MGVVGTTTVAAAATTTTTVAVAAATTAMTTAGAETAVRAAVARTTDPFRLPRATPAPLERGAGASLGEASGFAPYDPCMEAGRRTVLVVEDEESITGPLQEALGREGFHAVVARTAAESLELAARVRPDVILLDLMLPDGSGFDVCRELRRELTVPIIMLTARGDEADRVVGLELGADDYVVKPFSARELVARIRAVLRRTDHAAGSTPAGQALQVGDVRLDPSTRTVTRGEQPLDLTRREFDLLRVLMGNAGSLVTRERLIDEVWDVNWFGSTKTLDVHVSGLRKKLADDPAAPRYLHTIRGVGFRFADEGDARGRST